MAETDAEPSRRSSQSSTSPATPPVVGPLGRRVTITWEAPHIPPGSTALSVSPMGAP